MNTQELLKDKTCYIVSSELKHDLLNLMHSKKLLLDVHFFSLSSLIEKVYFSYGNEAIFYVSKKYNMNYTNAKIIINNLYYLMYSNNINNDKINYLKNIKNDLDDHNLLKYDNTFLSWLSKYNIISDLSTSNSFLYKINELLGSKIKFIRNEELKDIEVLEFNDSDEEISYIANEIGKLLTTGIEPSKINILNANDDYSTYIEKIFSLYNIPFHINSSNSLYNIPRIKQLYKEYLKGNTPICSDQYSIKFLSIINSLEFINNQQDKNDFLLYLLKSTNNQTDNYENIINFTSCEEFYSTDKYYFFIGLNNKVFPNYKKDEDYLSDDIKKQLGYIDSKTVNALIREYYINRLKHKNLTISFRNSDYFNSYLKSDLIELLKAKIVNKSNINKYSYDYDRLQLTNHLDTYYKFNKKSDKLEYLLSIIDKKDYDSYSNAYTKVDKDTYYDKILGNKLNVSYSSFEKYNQCRYKYYLDTVLKENDSSFNTYIGNLFHHILERIYDEDFDYNDAIKSYDSDYMLTDKEKILLDNLLIDFENKIKIILNQYNKGEFKKVDKEKRISLKRKTTLSIEIKGFIDKIMMDDDNNAYIVDYKTGDTKLTLKYLDYGLKCQLPFYFYLLTKSKEFANVFLVGCYLQTINFKFKSPNKNEKELSLEGLTYNDENIIGKIDNFYKEDSFIKGIKPNSKGLGTYSKTYTNKEFEKIISKMDENIEKMINDVSSLEFEINPKILKSNETTCKFCNYKDICYKNINNYIDLRKVISDEMDQ